MNCVFMTSLLHHNGNAGDSCMRTGRRTHVLLTFKLFVKTSLVLFHLLHQDKYESCLNRKYFSSICILTSSWYYFFKQNNKSIFNAMEFYELFSYF